MRNEFVGKEIGKAVQDREHQIRESENWIASRVKLILNIAAHENEEFRNNRHYLHAELFPMSWPDEEIAPRKRAWLADGILRLLHLGSIDAFMGYDSLKFIFENVLPLIPKNKLKRMEWLIAGKVGQSQYSQHIQQLAKAYPQVRFLGFVDDLKDLYGQVDIQIVGGTRATGLRTRIIESFVFGVPVLSTVEAARGVAGLSPERNIILAQDAAAFARLLAGMLTRPEALADIAQNARRTYDICYSRGVAVDRLASLLEKYL
ncbi:MAG: glycosyltransferase [Anaerolineales bacterium]|nr:glycosyltransferase [Anaerolineales bacterium]